MQPWEPALASWKSQVAAMLLGAQNVGQGAVRVEHLRHQRPSMSGQRRPKPPVAKAVTSKNMQKCEFRCQHQQ